MPAGALERYVFQEISNHLDGGPQPSGSTRAELAELIQRVEYDGQLGDLKIKWRLPLLKEQRS